MYGKVEWVGGSKAECFNEHGQSIIVDWEEGPNPVQITLQMIGACSLADIEIGLKDRAVSKIWIELDGERATDYPRVFTKITMKYHIVGEVPMKLVTKLVQKSHEKYCSVSNMFKPTVDMSSQVFVNGELC